MTLPKALQELLERSTDNLTDSETERLHELLFNYQHAFLISDRDLGTTHMVQHRIDTGNALPIRIQHDEIERQVTNLLQQGKMKESSSPWSFPVVIATKKDGSQRLCVDYHQLNAVTIKDAFPLPQVDDSLAALSGSRWFQTLDLASGYWKVAMDAGTQEKAAFVTSSGLYERTVMPFGLCNAPSTFARLMELVLKGLHWKICLIYLDDMIVMGRTFEEELERLKEVFERLARAGLKLTPKKCFLFQKRVSYLGHVVTEEGIAADPEKVEHGSCPFAFCVVEAKDPEGQLARWIDYLSTFDFKIQYRQGQRHLNADALSRRPCDVRCKWCKGWKSQERASSVDVGVQTVMHVPVSYTHLTLPTKRIV